jgi:hypothetical protein
VKLLILTNPACVYFVFSTAGCVPLLLLVPCCQLLHSKHGD